MFLFFNQYNFESCLRRINKNVFETTITISSNEKTIS